MCLTARRIILSGCSGPSTTHVLSETAPDRIIDSIFELQCVSATRSSPPDDRNASFAESRHTEHLQDRAAVRWVCTSQKLLEVSLAVLVQIAGSVASQGVEVSHFPIVIHSVVIGINPTQPDNENVTSIVEV